MKISTVEKLEICAVSNAKDWLQIFVCSVLVSTATVLLVIAAVQVLGTNWQGWLKAVSLEVGIVALVLWPCSKWSNFWITKSTAAFLIFVSIFLLHTGVKIERSSKRFYQENNIELLAQLKEQRGEAWRKVKAAKENHFKVSNHWVNVANGISRQIEKIEEKLEGTTSSYGVLKTKSNSEFALRIAFLLLNLLAGHRLFKAFERQLPNILSWLFPRTRRRANA